MNVPGLVRSVMLRTFIPGMAAVFFFLHFSLAQTGAAWQSEIVDLGGHDDPRSFSSLVIDGFGNFHIAYSNRTGTVLRYAFRARQDKRWDTTTVDSTAGRYPSLAVDSHGSARIAYNSANLSGLHYASWDGIQWKKVLIDFAGTNRETSLVLDSHDQPHITYYREQYTDHRNARYLKYAYSDGERWYTQTVDHRLGSGRWNSLALDHEDRPFVSYALALAGDLGLAYLDHSAWEHSIAD